MDLCDLDTIRSLLSRHGFHFSKSMGQNFLIDPQIPRCIAESSGADSTCGVLEIGPGIGPLTAELAKRAGKVAAVELDKTLLPVLTETMSPYSNVEIIPGDAMKLDLSALAREQFGSLTPMVCANLPYNITTPILTKLIETPCFQQVTVMIQREVAQRLCAAPGHSSAVGSISLFLQYHMEVELLFDVPPSCFVPPPKVHSSVIRCVRRSHPPVEVKDEAFFFQVVRGAFLLRRKTLANSLAAALPRFEKKAIQSAMEQCGLSENARGEQLSMEAFASLANTLGTMRP